MSLEKYAKELEGIAVYVSRLKVDVERFKLALDVLASPKKIMDLPKYCPGSWYENEWKLSLGNIDLSAKNINPSQTLSQTARIEEFHFPPLPVFVFYQGDGGDRLIKEALMGDFQKFGSFDSLGQGYTIEVLEAKVLVPFNKRSWEWMSLARQVRGNIGEKPFSSFDHQYSGHIEYGVLNYESEIYRPQGLQGNLRVVSLR